MANRHIEVRPIAGALGAEISCVDLSDLDDAVFAEIHDAWLDNCVIFFRDQHITPAEQVAFARRFGEIHFHPYMAGMDATPEILEIIKQPGDDYTFGSVWHTDQMFNPQPAKATMLYAKAVPSRGGDTLFANQYLAYERLSDGMKAHASKLRTFNVGDGFRRGRGRSVRSQRYANNPAMLAKIRDPGNLPTESEHPLVRTHPETGRKTLYIGSHTETLAGFSAAEADPIIEYLRTHCTQPDLTCRFRWEPGSMAIWDNRCVQHLALADYDERRHMHRITIAGDTPY